MLSPRFVVNKPVNRLVTGNPKIGIRPTIDGRWDGVRESLENQTMEMAKRVATLLAKHLRHADGTGGMRYCRWNHWRYCRGSSVRGDIFLFRCRVKHHGEPMLVLWIGNDGYESINT